MNSCFKSLRRKIGVMTLAFACVLMTWWIRSRATFDCLLINNGDRTFNVIYSVESSLGWTRLSRSNASQELHFVGPGWSSVDISNHPQLLSSPKIEWTWRRFGFGIAENQQKLKRLGLIPYWSTNDPISMISGWMIPYWSIVIPLAMLSAWLLLSKPRAQIPAKELA